MIFPDPLGSVDLIEFPNIYLLGKKSYKLKQKASYLTWVYITIEQWKAIKVPTKQFAIVHPEIEWPTIHFISFVAVG